MSEAGEAPSLSDVSAIIVLHDSGDVIADCLQALPEEVEVIVVDNGSRDGGARTAVSVRPGANVVAPGTNLGFGGGCQAGALAATRELLLFLNPDARIDGAGILRLARTATEHPGGVVGPRLLTADHATRGVRGVLDIGKDALWLLPASERWFPAAWRHGPEPSSDSEHQVLYVEGACFLIRRSDLAAVGGFDPDLFLYFEETSLAHRLRLRGGAAWYEPRAVAAHVGQTSTDKRSRFATFHFYRSRVIFERKVFGHFRGRVRSLLLLATAAVALATAAAQQLARRRPGAVSDAFAVLGGTVAGIRALAGPAYRRSDPPARPP